MKKAFQLTLALTVAFAMLAPAIAQDAEKKKGKNKGKKQRGASASVMALIKGVKLTDEQKPKVEALAKEWGPKLAAANKKKQEILTDEQKKAQQDARKKAAADGKKGRDLQKAVSASYTLSAEQKTKYTAATKETNELRTAILKKVSELLTDEQKAKIPALNKKNKDGKKGKGKKKKDEDKEEKKDE